MTVTGSADLSALVSRNAAGEALCRSLRLYVGRGRRYTVKEVSRGAGIPERTLEAYMADPSNPEWRIAKLAETLSLAAFLGPEFTSELLSLSGQGAFWLPEDEPDPGSLAADTCDDTSRVVRAAVDGEFDEGEKRDLRVVGVRMVSRGAQLAALGRTRRAA